MHKHGVPNLADGDLLEQVHLDQLPYQTKHQPPFRHGLNMFSSSNVLRCMIWGFYFLFASEFKLWLSIPMMTHPTELNEKYLNFVIILSSASSFCHYIINIVINTLQSYEQGWDFHAAWRWRFSFPCWSPVNLWNCRMITSVQRTVQLKPTNGLYWASQAWVCFE